MKRRLNKIKLHTVDVVKEWTSKKWHKEHRWKPKTGKFIKRLLNRKVRHERW